MSFFSHYYHILKSHAPVSSLLIGVIFLFLCLIVIVARDLLSRRDKTKLKGLEKENRLFRSFFHLLFENNKDAAIRELRRLEEISPQTDEVYLQTARLLREKGEIAKAIRMNKSLLIKEKLDKKLRVLILTELGFNYRLTGNFQKAVEYFKEVIRLEPKAMTAQYQLVRLYEKLRLWDEAFEMQKRLLKLSGSGSNTELVFFKLEAGKEKWKKGERGEAVHCFKQALSIDKNNVYALLALGDAYDNQGKKTKALAFWKKACDRDYRFLTVLYPKMEKIYFETDRTDDLEILFKEVLDKHPGNASLYLLLGKFFLKKNMLNQSRAEFERALEINPLIPDAYALLLKINAFHSDENQYIYLENLRRNENAYLCQYCRYGSQEVFLKCPSCKKWEPLRLSF
jgi:lipopolysaccharide biosynthesis regulator YciM